MCLLKSEFPLIHLFYGGSQEYTSAAVMRLPWMVTFLPHPTFGFWLQLAHNNKDNDSGENLDLTMIIPHDDEQGGEMEIP